MKIGHIFDAIEIDNLDPRRFSQHLVDGWMRIRFAKPRKGYSDSDAIGAALIASENFAWKSSGWFDHGGITFPADLVPATKNREELRAHLEWMIDCRRDPETLKYIHKAITRQLPAPANALKSAVRRTSLVELINGLERFEEHHPPLAEALLTGRLWTVCNWLRTSSNPSKESIISTRFCG